MGKKLKVLHVVTVMDMGGIELTLMNYMRNMDRDKIQFDFLVHRSHKGFFDSEIKELGGVIHIAPKFSIKSFFSYNKNLSNLLRINDYDIVHSHLDALSFFPLFAAKRSGISVRIAHSHVNGFDKDLKYFPRLILRKLIPLSATSYLSCSESAGDFMFPKRKFEVLLNPVPIEKFRFNHRVRSEIRGKLKIKNEIVVGHIGRFDPAKNHKFIVDLAKRIKNDIVFVLVGGGNLLTEIERQVNQSGVKNVTFVGISNEVHKYYSAFDIFILPSLYEGLGLVAIEAQVNGLPVLLSNKISSEVVFSNNVFLLPLEIPLWEERLLDSILERSNDFCESLNKYDVDLNAKFLSELYTQLSFGKGN